MTTYHIHVSIRGVLRLNTKNFEKQYGGVLSESDGTPVTIQTLKNELSIGHEIIPAAGCDNFDWKTGCRGHDDPEVVK